MATVTKAGLPAPSIEQAGPMTDAPGGREYSCANCGHSLRVFGVGRHRVYFEPENTRLDQPVMDHACPECGRALPSTNRT